MTGMLIIRYPLKIKHYTLMVRQSALSLIDLFIVHKGPLAEYEKLTYIHIATNFKRLNMNCMINTINKNKTSINLQQNIKQTI